MRQVIVFCFLLALAACSSLPEAQFRPVPTPGPTNIPLPFPTVVGRDAYRPLQSGDSVEGVQVAYYYVEPSLDDPVVVFAFSAEIPQLVQVRQTGISELADFVREAMKGAAGADGQVSILGFDLTDPNATAPKPFKIDPNRPVEFYFGILPTDRKISFSNFEGPSADDIREGYKLIRRRDGGLLFFDLFDFNTLLAQGDQPTLNGGMIGLIFSSRVAELPFILRDPVYQQGSLALTNHPLDYGMFDKRVMIYDSSQEGLAAARDWILISRPGPTLPPMRIAP